MQELAAAIEKEINKRVQAMEAKILGKTATPSEAFQAPTTPPKMEDALAQLKNALAVEGVTFITRQPTDAYNALVALVTLIENLTTRVSSLETQNGDMQMLVSELKRRAAEKSAPKPPKPAKKKGAKKERQ